MGAVVGPNVGLSNFIGREVIRKVAEEADARNVCNSTEELHKGGSSKSKEEEK